MGFWNKLGKIALQAAPYVAAPFTGGASLMATGATQKLGQKWAEHDAKAAIAKGIAPSKFDKYLGMASGAAGLGSIAFGGALSGLGGAGKAASAASTAGKAASAAGAAGKVSNISKIANAAAGKGGSGWTGALGKIAGAAAGSKIAGAGGSKPMDESGASSGWEGQLGELLAKATAGDKSVPTDASPIAAQVPVDNRAAGMVNGFPLNQGQPKPRNYNPIEAGRNAALMSQPWRVGYDVHAQGPDDAEGNPQVITTKNPAIYPNYNPPVQAPPVSENGVQPSIFGDQLTQRYGNARKRNPAPIEEEAY